jgi:urease accessory protein
MTAAPASAVQKLLAWLSPSFPVGSYAYSHGLEWAIADGDVLDGATLTMWIADILRHGAGRNDAIVFTHAWRVAAAGDRSGLAMVAELATALQPSRERLLETTAQGRALLGAVLATWPTPRLRDLAAGVDTVAVPYPVALAITAAAHEIPVAMMLPAMLNAFVANLASAGVRAIPIGQTDGQRVIAALSSLVNEIAEGAAQASLDDLGGAALRADIASMKHETQYTRLFRS